MGGHPRKTQVPTLCLLGPGHCCHHLECWGLGNTAPRVESLSRKGPRPRGRGWRRGLGTLSFSWEKAAGLVGLSDGKEGHRRLDRTRAKCVPQLSQLIRTSLTVRALLKLLRPGTVCVAGGWGWGGVIPLLNSVLTQGQAGKRACRWDRS